MKKVLIMCYGDPETDPRPNRMIHWLKDRYQLTVLAGKKINIGGVESVALESFLKEKCKQERVGSIGEIWEKLKAIQRFLIGMAIRFHVVDGSLYEFTFLTGFNRRKEMSSPFSRRSFDLIITHDCYLLPLAFALKNKAKIMLDAREYYPKQFENRWKWRLLTRPFILHVCQKYLRRCDKVITVSNGLADEYEKEYGISAEVIMSFPPYSALTPIKTNPEIIKIIHHGNANPSRRTEEMIKMMDCADERFFLDLMLVKGEDKFWRKIISMAGKRKNVKIIPPVPMREIVSFTNRYDIGLFFCPASNFNLKHTLPNKLFEFIMARLAVAIGPSVEMRKVVEKYDCGFIADDFKPESLAKKLNDLTADKIMYYKEQSHKAAAELSANVNCVKVNDVINCLIGE